MLNVAVDATPLAGVRTGIGVAVAGLVGELASRPDLSLRAYGLTGRGTARLRSRLPKGVRAVPFPLPAAVLTRLWARSEAAPVELWCRGVDVVHGTNFVVPPARRAGRVVSVWDLTAVRFPEMCAPASLRYPQLVRRAVAGGSFVHTAARSVAEEVCEHFGADPSRVVVVPPGLDPPSTHPPARRGAAPYVLALGTTEPRKDLPGLVEAFGLVAAAHPDLELRIAGPPGWAEGELAAAIARSPFKSRIRRSGWVEDRPALVAGAALLAYPSVYEGFGLPPLEAMSLGVPVVATTAGALPEVAGGAAELVPPRDRAALAGAMDRVLSDGDLRARMVAAGRLRAASFTWQAAADAMIAAYAAASDDRG